MDKIEIKQNGDVYSCDIGISKEEWLDILKDEAMPVQYKEALLRFFYQPDYRGSCTSVCNELGGNPQSLNSYIAKCGEYVQKRLNRFLIIRQNGKPCYWLVPMCEGKDLPIGSEGTFEWQLRPELVEAIKDYLYWYLVECYKNVRKEISIDDDKWEEVYKWELITASKGKSPFEVVRNHVKNPSKSELGGFKNLIDAPRDNKTIKYLVENNPSELEDVLNRLADENVSLHSRLTEFKSRMDSLLPSEGYNSKANDERTAATILTCLYPEKYTIYKYEVYLFICKYLNVAYKPTGQCFEHFLDLLKPLCELTQDDEELQQMVAPTLEGKVKSNLLLAQDVLWVLFSEFPDRLGFMKQFVWRKRKVRLWLCAGNGETFNREALACGSSAKTIKDFRPFKSKNELRKAFQKDTNSKDENIPTAYWNFVHEVAQGDIVVVFEARQEGNKRYHLLYGWGVFTSDCYLDETAENLMTRNVEWHLPFLEEPLEDRSMGNSLFFHGTTEKQAEQIRKLLNIKIESDMDARKYQKYIELLKVNKNLILTGAPGTGKTYMAKAIAKEMEAEVGFVQFYPSYDYTDFVEGLRPISDGKGNVGFERRDGVFKVFCKQALSSTPIKQTKVITPYTITSKKTVGDSFWVIYNSIVDDIQSGRLMNYPTPQKMQNLSVKNRRIVFRADSGSPRSEKESNMKLLYDYFIGCNKFDLSDLDRDDYWKLIDKLTHGATKTIDYIEYNWLLQEMLNRSKSANSISKTNATAHPDVLDIGVLRSGNNDDDSSSAFVFIIDEINRGEISKIFGELFFSIDPGYRGEAGKVNTQYQNMIEEDDVFKDGFYVPENVYIIGTMNDIDRSVESMDFAMRRRFAWQEVTAEESYTNMIENDVDFAVVKDEIKQRMFNLNRAIAETEGLDEAYQIGAAYYRKYLDYANRTNPFDYLWENHLKGLLSEYLRGNRNAKELLEQLHKAYNKVSAE